MWLGALAVLAFNLCRLMLMHIKLRRELARRKLYPESGTAQTPASFSPSAYLDRISKYCEALWQEPREEYILILWWGLDGLRLNRDGSMEWVSKKEAGWKTGRKIDAEFLARFHLAPPSYALDVDERNVSGAFSACKAVDRQAVELFRQNYNLRLLQIMHIEQNRRLIEQIICYDNKKEA